MADKKVLTPKSSRMKKIIKTIIFSPINTAFVVVLFYFAMQAYFFDPSVANKIAFFAILGLWIFWFLAKKIFLLIAVLLLLCLGGYGYYNHLHKAQKQCEESGGYWNEETKECEEKVPLWEQIKRFIKEL